MSNSNVTYGFYNSVIGDRKYNAKDFGMLFDGLITDGVFSTIGEGLIVSHVSGNDVRVGTGKCWFNHTWTWVHEPFSLTCDNAEEHLNRYDAIIVEVNASEDIRVNTIQCVKGTPATNAQYPTLVHNTDINQYPLCYIYRPAGSSAIDPKNIKNMVGTDETPVVAASVPTIKVENFVNQWNAQFETFIETKEFEFDESKKTKETEFDESISVKETKADNSIETKESEFDAAKAAKEKTFDDWFTELQIDMNGLPAEAQAWYANLKTTVDGYLATIKDQLDAEAETALRLQIDENEIKNILMNGFVDGSKTISNDSSVITSVNSDGWTLVNTFTNNFLTLTSVLRDSNNTELGRLVKNISSDGLRYTSEITLL